MSTDPEQVTVAAVASLERPGRRRRGYRRLRRGVWAVRSLAAGVLGAVTGLVAFGAVAGAGHRFATAGLVTFVPAALLMVLFWLLPETRGREPEDLWPGT